MNSLERFEALLGAVNKNYKQVNAKITKLTARLRSNLIPQEVGPHTTFLQEFFTTLQSCLIDSDGAQSLVLKYCGGDRENSHKIDYEKFLLCLFQPPPRKLSSSTPRLPQEGEQYLMSVDRLQHFWNMKFGLRTGYVGWRSFEIELLGYFKGVVALEALNSFLRKIQIEIRKLTASATSLSKRWLLSYVSKDKPRSIRSKSSALRQKIAPLASLNTSLDREPNHTTRPRHNQTFSFTPQFDSAVYRFARLRRKILIKERCRLIKVAALADKGSTPMHTRMPRSSLTPKILQPVSHNESMIRSSLYTPKQGLSTATPTYPPGREGALKSLTTADGYKQVYERLNRMKKENREPVEDRMREQPKPDQRMQQCMMPNLRREPLQEKELNNSREIQQRKLAQRRHTDGGKNGGSDSKLEKKYKLLKQRYSEVLYERSLDRVKAEASQKCISALEKKLQEGECEKSGIMRENEGMKKELDLMERTVRTTHLLLAFYKLSAWDARIAGRRSQSAFWRWRMGVKAEMLHEEHCVAARTMIGVLKLQGFELARTCRRREKQVVMMRWKEAIGDAKINNGDLESARERELSVELCQSASPFTKSFHETRVKLIEVKENIPVLHHGEGPSSKDEVLLYDSIFASSAGVPDKTALNNTTLFEYSNPSFHHQKVQQTVTSPSVISPPCRLTTSHLVNKPGRSTVLAFSLVLQKLFQKQKSGCFAKIARFQGGCAIMPHSMLPDVSSEIAIVKNKEEMDREERSWTNPFKRLHSAQYEGESLGGAIRSRVCTPALRQVTLEQAKVLDLLSSALQGGVGRMKRAVFAHLQECRKYMLTRAEGERELKHARLCLAAGAIIRVLQRHVTGVQRCLVSRLETHYVTASFLSKRRAKIKSHPSSRLYSPQESRSKVYTEDAAPFIIKSPSGSVYDGGSLATTDICFSMRNEDRKFLPLSGRIVSYFSGMGEDDEARKFKALDMIVYLRKLFVARDQIRMTRSVFSHWLAALAHSPLRMQHSLPRNESYRMHSLPRQHLSGSKLKGSMRYYFPHLDAPQAQFYPQMNSEVHPLNVSATLGSPRRSQTSFYIDSASKRKQHPYFGDTVQGPQYFLNTSLQAGGTLGGPGCSSTLGGPACLGTLGGQGGTLSSHSRHREGTGQCSRSISPIMNQSFEEAVRGAAHQSFNAFHTFAQNSQRRKESVVSMEQCLSPTPLEAQFDTFYANSGKKASPGGDYWLRQSSQELKEAVAFIKEKLGMQL